jgi:hypothetical protein
MATYGSMIFAPLATFWYRRLATINFGSKTRTLVGSVALDQLAFTPVVLSIFFTSTTLVILLAEFFRS